MITTFGRVRDLYRESVAVSIGDGAVAGHHGRSISLLAWPDAAGATYTFVGVVGAEPVSGRHERHGEQMTDIVSSLLNGYACGAVAANVHPDVVGGTPRDLPHFARPIPASPELARARPARLENEAHEVMTAFVEAIDVPAALVGAALAMQDTAFRGGAGYDDLRRLRGVYRELLDGWPHLFAYGYSAGGPALDPAAPALTSAAVLQKLYASGETTDRAVTQQRLDVMHRLRGVVADDESEMSSAIEFACVLDHSWLPPSPVTSRGAEPEWKAFFAVADSAWLSAKVGGDIVSFVPPERPKSWRRLLAAIRRPAYRSGTATGAAGVRSVP
jgi:hypothetical protein